MKLSYIYLFNYLKWINPTNICKLTFLFHELSLKKGQVFEGLKSIFYLCFYS